MSKTGLQRRLLESHLIVAFAGILIILVLCVTAAIMGRSGVKLFESAGPIPNSSLSLINGLQTSIAANHGWVYLGDRKFIDENHAAWQKIDSALHGFRKSVAGNTEIVSQDELEGVADSIERLRKLQAGIAYLPSSSDRSSEEIYTETIKPLESRIREMLKTEEVSRLLEQRSLLGIEKYFTETILQLELSIKSREYIDSYHYLQARDNLMLSTIPVAHQIAVDDLPEGHILRQLNRAIKTFIEKSDKANSSHQLESNNQVRQFLFEHAVPLSNSIILILQDVISRAQAQADIRRNTIKQITGFSLIASIVALLGLIISAVVLSMNNANKLVSRITNLSDAVEGFSENASFKPIAVDGGDEISHLARLFNEMALAIKEKQNTLQSYQNELELRVARRTRELFGAKEFAETTLRSVADALITVDSDLVISMFNPAAERLLGVSSDRAVGKPLCEIVVLLRCDDAKFDLISSIAESMQTRKLLSPEETLSLERANKTPVPVKVSLAPIADMKANKPGSILILRNVEREMELQSELSYQANHDPLTGLKNRASFNAEMDRLLGNTEDPGSTHVIAFLDLDKFKVINDSCGHAAGDELLKQISRLLSSHLRTVDILARLGGDEFAIMLRDCDIDAGKAIALNLRNCVANYRFSWEGRVYSVGVSIGITEFKPATGVLKDILTQADVACYAAKTAGRNKVRTSRFSSTVQQSANRSILAQENLLEALQQETPELKLKRLTGCIEAGSEQLFLPSLELVDENGQAIAEDNVSAAINRAGLDRAFDRCLLAKTLSLAAEEPFCLMLRLSEALFNDDPLFDELTGMLDEKSLPQNTLYFCFSEHSIFKNLESARSKLDVLGFYGVRTVMQDFSGSFSSIASIRGLSIDFLQIDPAIVNDVMLNPVHHIIVKTISDLAHVSGKKALAVGNFDKALSEQLNKLDVNVIIAEDNPEQHPHSDDMAQVDAPHDSKAS